MIKVGEKKLWASSCDIHLKLLRHGSQFPFPLPSCSHKPPQPLSHRCHCYIFYFPPVFSFSCECGCSGYGLVFNCLLPCSMLWSQSTHGKDHGDQIQTPFLKINLSIPKPPFMVASPPSVDSLSSWLEAFWSSLQLFSFLPADADSNLLPPSYRFLI